MSPLIRRAMLMALAVFAAVAGAWSLEQWLSLRPERPFAHTASGHLMGWAGLLMILAVLGYPARKYRLRGRRWSRRWFLIHMVCGTLGPLLILLHSGIHLHALVPMLALGMLGLIVVSGIIGQSLHYLALRSVNRQRQDLLQEGASEDDIDRRLHALASSEAAFRLWQVVHGPATVVFLGLSLLHIAGALYLGGF